MKRMKTLMKKFIYGATASLRFDGFTFGGVWIQI